MNQAATLRDKYRQMPPSPSEAEILTDAIQRMEHARTHGGISDSEQLQLTQLNDDLYELLRSE